MLSYKKILQKIGPDKSNYFNSVFINLVYSALVLPSIYFSNNSLMCKYWFFSLIIIYIIEGLFSQLKDEREKKMVYSAIATLQLYKGFNVVRTYSVQDSAEYILYTAHKIKREIERNNMPWTPDSLQKEEPINYCNFVKKTKKDNITPENIGEIILSQIPGISNVSACAIMNKFQSLPNLIDNLRNDPMCLNDIVCESKGKARKLSKNVSENIFKFLQ